MCPPSGKFALFNRAIVHWEGYVTLGVGAFMSQVIPVKRSDPVIQHDISAIFDIGVGSRLFLTKLAGSQRIPQAVWLPRQVRAGRQRFVQRASVAGACKFFLAGKTVRHARAFEAAYSDCRKENGSTSIRWMYVQFGLGAVDLLAAEV
jgi:hypothetical protein